MGIILEKTKNGLDILSEKFTNEIYEKYIKGEIKMSDLPIILGANRYVIETYMKNNGLKFRRDVLKENIDDIFFDEINTEEKAYMLGYYYADGTCNDKSYNITMSQTKEDSYIIELFKKLSPYTKITETKECYNRTNGHISKPMLSISINSKHMVETMTNYGIGKNKTYRTVTDFSFVPKEFMIHFIRGYFDGDGCVSVTNGIRKIKGREYKYHNYTWSIISHNKEPLCFIKNFLEENYEIYSNVIQEKRGNYLILINRKNDFFKFRDILYQNAEFFLSRKKEKYYSYEKI